MTTESRTPTIVVGGLRIDPKVTQAAIEACKKAGEAFIYIGNGITVEFKPWNTNTGDPVKEFEILARITDLVEEAKTEKHAPVKPQPFWTQQGRHKNGGRSKY